MRCSLPGAHLHVLCYVLRCVLQSYTSIAMASIAIRGTWACLCKLLDGEQCDIPFVTSVGLTGSCGREMTGLVEVLV